MPIPFIGAAIGGAARKLGAKALRWGARRAFGTRAGAATTGAAAGWAAGRRTSGGYTESGQSGGSRRPPRDQGFGPDLNPFGTNDRTGAFFGFGGTPRRKYRRMNYLNQRALRKSIKRVQGFEKIVREAFTVSKGSLQLKKGARCR